MIPKIIHLCWLSGDEFPPMIQKCIDSWKRNLPDYEIWLWDTKRFDVDSVLWTKQAFECKKYAFAADYIRLYALYNYGGIYLDSDVLVYKSFDVLLDLPYFIGEDYVHLFEPAVVGCEPGNEMIGTVLRRYENRAFVKADGIYDTCTLPVVYRQELMGSYRFQKINHKSEFIDQEGLINVFSFDFFNSRDYIGPVQYPNSYCSHCFLGSWMKPEATVKKQLRSLLPRKVVNYLYYWRCRLGQLRDRQIPYSDESDLQLMIL